MYAYTYKEVCEMGVDGKKKPIYIRAKMHSVHKSSEIFGMESLVTPLGVTAYNHKDLGVTADTFSFS